MTTFNMTAKRKGALKDLVSTAADADAAADALECAVKAALKAGFTPEHFASAKQGGAGVAGPAYQPAMELAAKALLKTQADKEVWAGENCPARSKVSNRLSAWVRRLAKRLDATKAGKATGAKAKGTQKAPLARDRDAIAARRNYLTTAIQQKTDVQKAAVAAYGGEAKAKEYLAAWDTIAAVYK